MTAPLTVEPLGGLCNRMRVVASGAALAGRVGRPLRVVWRLDDSLNCPFHRLFLPLELSCVVEHVSGKPPGPQSNVDVLGRLVPQPDVQRLQDHPDEWCRLAEAGPIHVVSWLEFYRDQRRFDIFRLQPRLARQVADVAAQLGPCSVGVHIRRTDHHLAMRYSSVEGFIARMQREFDAMPGARCFLATDDEHVEDEVMRRCGAPVLRHVKRSRNRADPVAIEDAAIDLYCLARTRRLLGSYGSSFSETAAALGRMRPRFD